MVKPKPEDKSSMRTPGPKKKLGLAVPPALRMPHEDLIIRQINSEEMPPPSHTSQTSQPRHTRQSSHTRHTANTSVKDNLPEPSPIAPQRDYTKTANSIVREAIPGGFFKGKSKQIYDCLYSMTRGAIVPTRKVRISRPKLMTKAHIGSRVTFDANISHLKSVGLIRVVNITGEHEGNEYEVILPEEVSIPSQSSHTSQTSHASKVVILDSLESSQTSHTLSTGDSTTSGKSKTSYKTSIERTDDDAALAGLIATIKTTSKEITGKELSASEEDRWKELAEVLMAELKIAAARTTVSSVPAFLAEHLRRRLWKIDKKQAHAEGRELPDETSSMQQSTADASSCPDCGGSGWWYPEGESKGVAKCKHEKLATKG
jgi:phage gp16-like protein